MSSGAPKPEPRRVLGFYEWGRYGVANSKRRMVWVLWDVLTELEMTTFIRWDSDETPRHDRHVTPYDPRLVVGCETARPGPIARFLMSQIKEKGAA